MTCVDYSSATSQNSIPFTNEEPRYGIDNNSNTKWCAKAYTTAYTTNEVIFQIDYGKNVYTTKYNYITGNDNPSRDPISWNIQISSDNINWTTVSTITNATITDNK